MTTSVATDPVTGTQFAATPRVLTTVDAILHGYHGNGFSCFDRDEFAQEDHLCHKKARCINNEGSYKCLFDKGYHGNGRQCKGI